MGAKSKGSILAPQGSLTIFEVASLQGQLLELLARPAPHRLDLSAVTSLDTSCVQLLLAARRPGGGLESLEMTGMPPGIQAQLQRLDALTRLESSPGAAEPSLSRINA